MLSLSRVIMDLTTEDIQKGSIAYKEGKGQVAAYTKLRQGQNMRVLLDSIGSDGMNDGESIDDNCS